MSRRNSLIPLKLFRIFSTDSKSSDQVIDQESKRTQLILKNGANHKGQMYFV